MDKKQQNKLKTAFSAIEETLQSKDLNLTEEERIKFERLQSEIAGTMMSSWLPAGSARKVVALILFIAGLFGFLKISGFFILLWLLLPFFSPRLVGEIAIFFGKMFKK